MAIASHSAAAHSRVGGRQYFRAAVLLGLVLATATSTGARAQLGSPNPEALVGEAARRSCVAGMDAAPLPDAQPVADQPLRIRGMEGEKRVWRLGANGELQVSRIARLNEPGSLYFADYYAVTPAGRRPLVRAVVGPGCRLLGGRKIVYRAESGDDVPIAIQPLSPGLLPVGTPTPLNPDVPAGEPGKPCVRVGLLDNGVNYLLPQIARALARDEQGRLVGYDYWEEDRRPFDYGVPVTDDPRISPFSPRHHGTGVASILIRDAGADPVCIAAYRYLPMDPEGKIGRIVDDMAAAGVRVVNLSSGRSKPWPEFLAAMRAHPEMLFVLAAGNEGVDLNRRAYYPGAYKVDNSIIVAAADSAGNLWRQSNRGEGAVHLAVPAVALPGFDFDGRPRPLTGTSLAAPRISALAARLLVRNPQWNGRQLRTQILQIATSSGVRADGIPVLTDAAIARALP